MNVQCAKSIPRALFRMLYQEPCGPPAHDWSAEPRDWASVVCAALWFILLNAFPGNPEIASTIPFLALFINTLLVPVVPLMASDSSIEVFKTSVHAVISKDGNVVAKPMLNAHPLEMRWAQESDDEEFLLSVAERVLALFTAAE